MTEWVKGKIKQGIEAGQKVIIANSLASHFASLEDPKTGIPGIATRLAHFVLNGEDHNAVAELVTHRTTSRLFYYVGDRHVFSKGLGTLLKLLPEDPEIYSRLASVYDAASSPAYSAQYSPIPGFNGSHRWVYAFLAELSEAGPKHEKYFSADLLAAMLAEKQEDPAVLVRGALIVLNQQGKNQFGRWSTPPYTYFRCLTQFPDLVLRFPEVVIEALHQSNAAARAYTLTALTALQIPIDRFLEQIAALAVSNSKEVRESAAPILEKAFPCFQPLITKFASGGTSDERYNAVRLLGQFSRAGSRAFLQERLDGERAEKVLEAIRESLSTSQVSGYSEEAPGREEWGPGSKKTTALVLSPTSPGTLDFGNRLFTSWNSLSEYVRNRRPLGLRDPNPLDMLVVLEPSAFGLRTFDRPTQTFTWEIYDEQDQMLLLSLPFREWHSDAIKVLEALVPPVEQRWRVLTRIAQRHGSLSLEPISILRPGDHAIFQLSFDVLPQTSEDAKQDRPGQAQDDTDSPDEDTLESEHVVPKSRYLKGVITELNRRMQNIAEAGCQGGFHESREWFRTSYRETSDAGLTYLATLLKSLSETPSAVAPLVLRARFVSDLHAQASAYAD